MRSVYNNAHVSDRLSVIGYEEGLFAAGEAER